MENMRPTRPPFSEALAAWSALLQQSRLPTDMLWLFEENLCFEADPARPGQFRLAFQTTFSPPPPDAAQVAYEYFCGLDAPLVFYRAGSAGGKSVCLMLCDEWFATRGEGDGFVRRDEWLISFRPGPADALEEITDRGRWESRVVRGRPLHDLDFCLTLRSIHETLAHGRVLSVYERYALRFLHYWRRVLGSGH